MPFCDVGMLLVMFTEKKVSRKKINWWRFLGKSTHQRCVFSYSIRTHIFISLKNKSNSFRNLRLEIRAKERLCTKGRVAFNFANSSQGNRQEKEFQFWKLILKKLLCPFPKKWLSFTHWVVIRTSNHHRNLYKFSIK